MMIVVDIEVPVMLGYGYLKDNNGVIKVGTGTLYLDNEQIACHLGKHMISTLFRIRVAETTVVPPATEVSISTGTIL